jgi:hypothetical protein
MVGVDDECVDVLAPSTTRAHPFSTVLPVATRSNARVSTAVRLPAELHAELQRHATERDVSVNFLVTRAITHYLKAIGPADPLERPGAEGAFR